MPFIPKVTFQTVWNDESLFLTEAQRRSRFTHPLQALSAEFSIIVWFAAVIAQGENTKTKPIHAPSSGFPVSEFGIIIWFTDVRAQANLSLVEICSIKYVQVQVHESQNGAVVLDGGIAAIVITVFKRQYLSYFAFVEEAILVHGRDFSVL